MKSVEKAVCILKLIFFKLDKRLKDIEDFEDPRKVREITEAAIIEAGKDPGDMGWLSQLGNVYSEIYAQWFDSLPEDELNDLIGDRNRFIVNDQREVNGNGEKQVVSAFNIIGTSIHRALQIAEFATKKIENLTDWEGEYVKYTWAPRDKYNPTVKTEIKNKANTTRNSLPTHTMTGSEESPGTPSPAEAVG